MPELRYNYYNEVEPSLLCFYVHTILHCVYHDFTKHGIKSSKPSTQDTKKGE